VAGAGGSSGAEEGGEALGGGSWWALLRGQSRGARGGHPALAAGAAAPAAPPQRLPGLPQPSASWKSQRRAGFMADAARYFMPAAGNPRAATAAARKALCRSDYAIRGVRNATCCLFPRVINFICIEQMT